VELHSWFVRLFWSSPYSRTIIVAVCRRSFFHVVRFFSLSRTLKLISSAWESLVDWVFIRAAYRLMTTNSGFLAWKRYVCDEWAVLRFAIWLSQISCQLCRLRNRLAGSPVCQARCQLLCFANASRNDYMFATPYFRFWNSDGELATVLHFPFELGHTTSHTAWVRDN